jgi:HK97 family phage portal protein
MSFIDKLFRRSGKSRDRSRLMRYDVNQYRFVTWDKKATDLYLIRASVDALARNIAKMQLEAVIYTDRERAEKKVDRTSDVARVLRHPNQYMTQYDFLYKVAAMFYTTNNVFIYPEYKDGRLIALHPINYEDFSIYETDKGTLIAKFRMNYYQTYSILYDDLIHLRNHFMTKDLIGDSNGDAIKPITELLTTQNQGIINGIKNSAIIRGILKAANVIKDEDMKAARDRFVEDNLRASNAGGVIGIDGKFEYQNIESKPYIVDAQSMAESKKMIFDYFGITEGFITNAFTPEEYEAIYEGRLEPFAIMLTQGLTHGLYTERELGFGNEIEGNMSKVKYQPISAITALIGATNQLGLFRKNEYREMLGYPPLADEDGGNDIVISLNYVNNDKLDEYQGVNENE